MGIFRSRSKKKRNKAETKLLKEQLRAAKRARRHERRLDAV